MLRTLESRNRRGERHPARRLGSLIAALVVAGAVAALATVTAAGSATTFTPVADTYVDASQPGASFGADTQLRADDSPVVRAYLRFDPQNIGGAVATATLRLWANSTHSKGYTLWGVANTSWGETTLTAANAPPLAASPTGTSGPYAAGSWTQVDVTSLVTGPGPVSFGLTIPSSGATSLGSRESGAHAPQLVIETAASADTQPPTAPTSLRTTSVGATSVALAWTASTDNVGVTGYRVFRGATQIGTPTDTTFTDTGLTPATAYSYTVRAVDAAGNPSAASSALAVTTAAAGGDSQAPSVPTGLRTTSVGSTTVTLAWTASTDNVGVTGYRVFRGATQVGTPTGTSFTDTGLTASTTFSYTVRAADAAGNVSGASAALPVTTAPATSTSDPVIAAAGDIACDPLNPNFKAGAGTSSNCKQKATSDLLAGAGLAAVLPLGDNQYWCGSLAAFQKSYDLSWGRLKSITRPAVGNHEYVTSGSSSSSPTTGCDSSNTNAVGYFKYFGSAGAGVNGKGYYSYDIGRWHLIALNAECGPAGGCGTTSAQGKWLAADLAAHKNTCTLAYWHEPLFSSGGRASSKVLPFWQLLQPAGVDVVLNGHDHIYERFAPQTSSGAAAANGIREFIVGTGGANHTGLTTTARNSVVRNASTYGVLKLTLHPTSYDWKFVPISGGAFGDSGTGTCH